MRLALGISYNGQAYEGWQSQPSGRTVQDRLEHALTQFAAQPVIHRLRRPHRRRACTGSCRWSTSTRRLEREEFSWVRGTNRFLPPDIAVQWAQPVPDAFHSRACATARRYAYVVLESAGAAQRGRRPRGLGVSPTGRKRHAGSGVAADRPARLQLRFAHPPARPSHRSRRSTRVEISRRGAYWRFEFEADAFLHHMIRNIMGCLLQVGQGQQPAAMDGPGAGRPRPRRRGAHLFARRAVFSGPGLRPRMEPAQPYGCV